MLIRSLWIRRITSTLWAGFLLWVMAAAPAQPGALQVTPTAPLTRTPPPTPTTGSPVPAQPAWSAPQRLSVEGSNAWFPDVAADPTGLVHVVWSAGISLGLGRAYDAVMYTSSRDGATWEKAADIVAIPSKGAVTRSTLLVDPQGLLHLTYRSYTIYYSHARADAVSAPNMLPPREISVADSGYFSRMALDSRGRLHLVFTENVFDTNCTGCFHAFYRWSDTHGEKWSDPVDITPFSNGVAKPQIVIDSQDNLFVAFEIGRGGDLGQVPDPSTVGYVASYNAGATWTAPTVLAAADDEARNIALGQTGSGTLVAVWLSPALGDDTVLFRTSTDAGHTWSDTQTVPGVWGAWTIYQGRTDGYVMTTDSVGTVHLVLVGRTAPSQRSLSVINLLWNGVAWSKPVAVTTIEGDVPEWPRLSIGNGNQLHLVWFVRNKAAIFDSNNAQYQVWYAHGVADAPAIPPIAWPTPAPATPSATATPGAATIATATSGPTVQPLASGSPVSFYSETSYLITAAESIVPVLALLLVVIVVVRLRRR